MQAEQLIETLKRALKAHKLTYAMVARGIGMSEANVKRLFSQKSFSLATLEAICSLMGLDFYELAKQARQNAERQGMMSVAQEQALAQNPLLLGVFYLVYNDWKADEILRSYHISKPALTTLLLELDKIKLIDLMPGDLVKLRVSRPIRVRPDGPIRQTLGQSAVDDFLSVRYSENSGVFRFEFRELSEASYALLQRKIEKLVAEFHELAEVDTLLAHAQRRSYGFVQCLRPWQIERISGLKLRDARADSAISSR